MNGQELKESESICTECGDKTNDHNETKWNGESEPFCIECFENMRDMAELKSLSNYSLEHPLSDSEYK